MSIRSYLLLVRLGFLLAVVVSLAECHGYLKEPGSRNWLSQYMSAYGCQGSSSVESNTDYTALNCGGLDFQQTQTGGRCGACGDKYNVIPRPHENGGRFYSDNIVKVYFAGCMMDVAVHLTAAHKGWFEFRLCHDLPGSVAALGSSGAYKTALDYCFGEDTHHRLLEIDAIGTRAGGITSEAREFRYQLAIPADVRCEHCVLQWKYHGGNNWGGDAAPQEEFFNCADVSVIGADDPIPRNNLLTCGGSPHVATKCATAASGSTTSTGGASTYGGTGNGPLSLASMICELLGDHTGSKDTYESCCHPVCTGADSLVCALLCKEVGGCPDNCGCHGYTLKCLN